MYSTSDFKKGLKIELEGAPFVIVDFQHVKPGKGGAFVRTKLKNLLNSRVVDRTFRSGEKVDPADVDERSMQYLYREGDMFIVMDNETYEQTQMPLESVGDAERWLLDDTTVTILVYKGAPVNIEVPNFINFEIMETEPGFKGDTAQGGTKPAKIATGTTINVPLFINEGDIVRIDTRTGDYLERVKTK
ncbi:elongation factor P [bacterium]|nr:elongation factor P [bacterium]